MAKVLTAIRLEEETVNKIGEIASKKKRKTTELMRLIIEDYIEKQELGNF